MLMQLFQHDSYPAGKVDLVATLCQLSQACLKTTVEHWSVHWMKTRKTPIPSSKPPSPHRFSSQSLQATCNTVVGLGFRDLQSSSPPKHPTITLTKVFHFTIKRTFVWRAPTRTAFQYLNNASVSLRYHFLRLEREWSFVTHRLTLNANRGDTVPTRCT